MEVLAKSIKVKSIAELRPTQRILDDRIPEWLHSLDRPTFITIDGDFWNRSLCHPGYCILHFDLADENQPHIIPMLRALPRMPEFATRAARLGKVVRAAPTLIEYFESGRPEMRSVMWKKRRNGN